MAALLNEKKAALMKELKRLKGARARGREYKLGEKNE